MSNKNKAKADATETKAADTDAGHEPVAEVAGTADEAAAGQPAKPAGDAADQPGESGQAVEAAAVASETGAGEAAAAAAGGDAAEPEKAEEADGSKAPDGSEDTPGVPTDGPADQAEDGERSILDYLSGDDRKPKPQNDDVNALAAACAASMAYGTTNDDDTALPRMDIAWMIGRGDSGRSMVEAVGRAGAFLRQYPEANDEATRIELTRKKVAQPLDEPRAAMAWRIFVHSFRELEAETAARTERDKAAATAAPARATIAASAAAIVPGNMLSR